MVLPFDASREEKVLIEGPVLLYNMWLLGIIICNNVYHEKERRPRKQFKVIIPTRKVKAE